MERPMDQPSAGKNFHVFMGQYTVKSNLQPHHWVARNKIIGQRSNMSECMIYGAEVDDVMNQV